jgi:hypothetical protein
MSKKLIAMAAAAALALTGLVATPANATTITDVTIWTNQDISAAASSTVSHTGTTSVSAVTAASTRTVDFAATGSTTRTAVRFVVTTSAATTVTVSSTLGVKISESPNDADGKALSVTAGTQSLAIVTTATKLTAEFYAWNTSTTSGKVNIATPGSLNSYNVKGTAGLPYNLTEVKFPTSITSGVAEADGATVSFQVTDMFGNKLSTANLAAVTTSALGATISAATYDTVRKQYEAKVFGTATSNVAMSVSLTAVDLSANGFAKPIKYAYSSVSGGTLETQVTTLTAQVATLQTQITALTDQLAASRPIADSVTKKKYNTLARKWNAANPGAKVALKK